MDEKEILKESQKLQKQMVEWRRFLHSHAEIGFDLPTTREYVAEKLREMGYKPQKCGKAGVVTEIGKAREKSAKDGVLLLRADMDGLPIQEETGKKFACKTGNMHACGHDMHTAMLLGVAQILKNHEKELGGRVRLLFQPAEEILEGAKNTIEAGVLKDVVGATMLHVLTGLPLESGTVVVSSEGVSAPAADYFTVEVKGKGCHGSSPQNGIDAALVAAQILVGLQTILAREIPPSQTAALTIGSLQAGNAGNAIADTAKMQGTLRAFDEDTRAFMKKRLKEIAEGGAKTFRASVGVEFTSGCPSLLNDGKMSAFAYEQTKKLLGEKRALTSAALDGGAKNGSGGSEDFAYISREVPSVMIALCAGEKGKGFDMPLHHPKTEFDESALCVGAAVFAQISIKYFEN